MVTSSLKSRLVSFWVLPVSLFLFSLLDGRIAKLLTIPEGVTTTIIELVLAAYMFVSLKKVPALAKTKYLLIPICIGLGDFFYGLSNYALKLPFPNQLGCLLYVIPYLTGLGLLILGLVALAKNASRVQSQLLTIGTIISLGVLGVIFFNLIIPALFFKQPPLSPLFKTLTVLFSVLEAAVIGGSATLLLCAASAGLQVGLFGVLVMHLSDMAIRYQSVRLDLMGMSFFENGWCLGLALMAVGAAIQSKSESTRRESPLWLPLTSIRSATIAFVLIGFVTFWIALGIFYKSIGIAQFDSIGLLVLTGAFAFSIIIADFVTSHVAKIVLSIENQEQFDHALDSPFMPYEIGVITRHFRSLTQQVASEKDKILALTSSVSHDLRGPLGAMQRVLPLLREDLGSRCSCSEKARPHLNIIGSCVDLMAKTAADLLKSRKSALNGEGVDEAIQNAASLVRLVHAESQIVVETQDSLPDLKVHGLTRALSNLIQNAVEASPEGKSVYVSARTDHQACEIIIKDHGEGISADTLRSIEQGKSITTKQDGNGIGLPFVLSWAKQNGVSCKIASAINQGTEVRLRLSEAR